MLFFNKFFKFFIFREKNLLFTPGFSSLFTKFQITQVLGHEIAHMWFGNMVTPKWWDQVWLNEGFSNFFEIIAADHVRHGNSNFYLTRLVSLNKKIIK